MRTNAGEDFQAKLMGGDIAANDGTTGTSTSTTATTLVHTGAGWTTDQWRGHIVTTANRYGVILSNTTDTLTIDRWYDPTNPSGASGSTPAAGVYVVDYSGFPAVWYAVTESATTPVDTMIDLTTELGPGSGWDRRLATYAHTNGVNTYTLTTTFTSADGTTRTLARSGIFNSQRNATGQYLMFTTLISPTAVLISGDAVTLTTTVTY